MRYIFLLSKENIELAVKEVLILSGARNYEVDENLMLVDIDSKEMELLAERLAYTKKIFRFLFSCDKKELRKTIDNFNWNQIYKENFSVKKVGKGRSESELASYIWKQLDEPKVDLKNPETPLYFLFYKKIYCGVLKREVRQDFEARKTQNRPEPHPSSLHPKLARAMVNLTGIIKGRVVDPFCGSGGILLEAGLMGIEPAGYDIDQIMINRAKINLDYYGIKGYTLEKRDACNVSYSGYVVADLPYGRNTKSSDLKIMAERFLFRMGKIKKAVIGFPLYVKDNINYKSLIKKHGLSIEYSFIVPLHGSLKKKIYVIKK